MGFEAVFGQRRLRHEAGESGNAQEWTAIDGIDLENGTVSLRRLTAPPRRPAEDPANEPAWDPAAEDADRA